MYCTIEEIIPAPPPPPEDSGKNDGSGKRLTAYYLKDHEEYEIDCSYSPCRTRCHFSSDVFGEVIFEHETEVFLASTRLLDDDYLAFLRRVIRQWKQQFPDF
jgi:hypothetical protein